MIHVYFTAKKSCLKRLPTHSNVYLFKSIDVEWNLYLGFASKVLRNKLIIHKTNVVFLRIARSICITIFPILTQREEGGGYSKVMRDGLFNRNREGREIQHRNAILLLLLNYHFNGGRRREIQY